jgi:hypothetical protein
MEEGRLLFLVKRALFSKGCLAGLEYKRERNLYITIDYIEMEHTQTLTNQICSQCKLGFLKLLKCSIVGKT